MPCRRFGHRAVALIVGIVLLAPAVATADFRSQNGNTFLSTAKLKKAKKFDGLISTIVVPPDFGEISPFSYYCTLSTTNRPPDQFDGTPIKKVKARWQARAYLLDHRDDTVEMLDIASGVFKTDKFGDFFLLDVPQGVTDAIFTDGFESGEVSALLVTEADFTRGKKMNFASLQCLIQEGSR